MTPTNDFRVAVRAEYLAAAALFRSDEVTRYYLHGVAVEQRSDDGLTLIATDGTYAVMIRDCMAFGQWDVKSGEEEMLTLRVTPKLLAAASKRSNRHGSTYVVYSPKPTPIYVVEASLPDEAIAVVDKQDFGAVLHVEACEPLIDCRYPDVRRCFPPEATTYEGLIAPFGFNAEAMAVFAKAHRMLHGGRGTGMVAITLPVKNGPMWIRTSSDVMVGWMMPFRWVTADQEKQFKDLAPIYAHAVQNVVGYPKPYSPAVAEPDEAELAAE